MLSLPQMVATRREPVLVDPDQRVTLHDVSWKELELLLAIRGHQDSRGPTIGEAAGYLFLRHHSAVGLVDRAEAAGLLERMEDQDDRRVVRLRLTGKGADILVQLSQVHLEELTRLAPEMRALWAGLEV